MVLGGLLGILWLALLAGLLIAWSVGWLNALSWIGKAFNGNPWLTGLLFVLTPFAFFLVVSLILSAFRY